MKNALFWGNKDFRILWMRERQNGEHVIHVTLWWRHGKQHRSDSRWFRYRWRSGQEVSDHVWINSGSRRTSSSGYANFEYPDGKVASYLVCKVSVIIRSWLITPRHAKLCEQLGKWPVAILTGHWLHFAWSRTKGYILMWAKFHNTGAIALNS